MKTLLIAVLMLLSLSSTAKAIPPCEPWEGYVWGHCMELYPELKSPKVVTKLVYIPVIIHHYPKHQRHWWNR